MSTGAGAIYIVIKSEGEWDSSILFFLVLWYSIYVIEAVRQRYGSMTKSVLLYTLDAIICFTDGEKINFCF